MILQMVKNTSHFSKSDVFVNLAESAGLDLFLDLEADPQATKHE